MNNLEQVTFDDALCYWKGTLLERLTKDELIEALTITGKALAACQQDLYERRKNP